MDESQVLVTARTILVRAIEERRGLVAFSRLEAIEMDRRAREVERDALEQLRQVIPAMPVDRSLHGIKNRLHRMEEHLEELAARQGIQERSRALEQDDIRWRAFEDIISLLGLA